MQRVGLSLLEAVVLVSLSLGIATFVAALGALIRYTTRPPGSRISVYWITRLGIFAGIPFSIIGVTSGYLTGLSRVSAVSALVPAGLTLIRGVAVYLFGKGGKAAVLAAFAVVNFSLMILVGALIGGWERVQAEEVQNSIEYREQEINKEFILKEYRRGLGLDQQDAPQRSPKPVEKPADDDNH